MLELIFNISNVGYLFLNDVTNGAVIRGPVVQRLSTKPGVSYSHITAAMEKLLYF